MLQTEDLLSGKLKGGENKIFGMGVPRGSCNGYEVQSSYAIMLLYNMTIDIWDVKHFSTTGRISGDAVCVTLQYDRPNFHHLNNFYS